jgi:hypothetical protein
MIYRDKAFLRWYDSVTRHPFPPLYVSLSQSFRVSREKGGRKEPSHTTARKSLPLPRSTLSLYYEDTLFPTPPPPPFWFFSKTKDDLLFRIEKKTFWLEKQEKILQRLTAISSGKLSCFSPYPSYFLIPSFLVLTSQERILFTSSFPDSYILYLCLYCRTLGLYLFYQRMLKRILNISACVF